MKLPPDIHLQRVDYDAEVESSWRSILSPEEIERRAVMKSESRRKQFVLGRIALRTLLGSLLDRSPRSVRLCVEESGRVRTPDSSFRLSIAHSGERAVATAAERESGVDLECMSEKPESLLDYILNENESVAVKALPLSAQEKLFLTWTLKEAVLKALGTGLRIAPRLLSVSIDLSEQTAQIIDAEQRSWNGIFSISSPYVTAVAFR